MTIDEYMAKVPPARRGRVEGIMGRIRSWFPEARITIRYRIPTFVIGRNWVSVANQKGYVSVYTCSEEHIAPYIEKHPGIKHGTGCINFRDRDEIHFGDLREVVGRALKAERTI
jgi:uncharacterized protein YdhG (YjbR/CyaY superfamily)